ncbi:MAG: DUF1018 domain-containing protein [Bryobacterales bacterium]|nr:DUF1018 domain-containing protein [Bryobacterales bacterium]
MTAAAAAEKRRRADLAKIHIGKEAMGLDRAAYEDMLEAVTGERSSAGLDRTGRRKVLAHMQAKGVRFRPKRQRRPRPRPAPERERLIRKIDALLIDAGNRPRLYAERILRRMTRHPHDAPLEWAKPPQLLKVVQALEIEKRRREARARAREEAA